MKLQMQNSDASFNSLTKLTDKSLKLTERLKLAKNLWEFDSKSSLITNSNSHQFILDWIVDLLINNKRKKYSFDENDLVMIWDQLYFYLTDVRFKNNPIHNGLLFVQNIIDSMSSPNVCLKQSVFSCCAKLFNTKFSHYFLSNFDQMTNILNFFLIEFNEQFDEDRCGKKSMAKIDSAIERCHIVLQKYFTCLKSQQYHTRLFNPLSKQILFNVLKFMANLKQVKNEKNNEIIELAWNILKYGLFSKSHANVYLEFFKNLPISFAPSSNYQVVILFNTIQSESIKNKENLDSFCQCAHLMAKEFFTILTSIDYKQKICIIQFFIDLIWSLKTNGNSLNSQVSIDSIVFALKNLFQIVEEHNLFNTIDDKNNNDMFANWCKQFVKQSLKEIELNKSFADYLIAILRIDHLFLDAEMEFILDKLHKENSLETFLNFYLEVNVKFRQLTRVTHKLLEIIKSNKLLTLPDRFYDFYAECLVSHNVDSQTIVNIWKEINKSLESTSSEHPNFRLELLKFLNCIMSRFNLCNNRMPSHLKSESSRLLNENKNFLNTFLHGLNEFDTLKQNDELVTYLKCYYSCGLVYILSYRYSLNTDSKLQTIIHQTECFNEMIEFMNDLNQKFRLGERKSKDFNILYHLNKLELLNVYASNTSESFELPEKVFDNLFCLDYKLNGLSKNNSFNINETKLDSMQQYAVLHTKSIIAENAYLILPLLISRNDLRQQMYRNLIEISFALRKYNQKFEFDIVNKNALFNDSRLVKDLFVAFIEVLIDQDLNDDKSSSKFLKKCLHLITTEFGDESDKKILFDSKKFHKSELNSNQIKLFQMIVDWIPIEYLNANYGLICFFLNEKVIIRSEKDLEKFSISNYVHIAESELLQFLPMIKLESWLINLFDSLLNNSSLVDSKEIFDKVVRKGVNLMVKDNSADYLSRFVEKLFEKMEKNATNNQLISMVHLTFIQILEKICKMQEISDQKVKKDSSSSPQHDPILSFNILFKRLVDYFIRLNDTFESEERKNSLENHNYYLCSILMRRICSSQGFRMTSEIDMTSSEDQNDHVNYFNLLLNFCLKHHKFKVKELKKFTTEQCSKIKLSSFHMDFLKTFIFYSPQLNEKYAMKIDSVKYCEQFFNFYINLDQKVFEFDLDYLNAFKLDDKDAENSILKDQNEILVYVTRAICVSINVLSPEEFKQTLQSFETITFEHFKNSNLKNCLIKFAQLVKYLCSYFELDDKLKPEFSVFIQKFLVQIHPIYFSLLSNNDIDCLIELLNAQYLICSSKYILLPSHLVISSLQVYITLPYENFSLENNVNLQELACKTINTILTRYSKKFQKIAAIICNLFSKLINITTNLANQNELQTEDVNLVVKASQNLERVASQLVAFKQDFSKITPYLISEYVLKANRIPLHPSIKIVLTNVMYNLISICDVHGVSQLHIVLPAGAKELFKNIYAEYNKYFKYKGKS